MGKQRVIGGDGTIHLFPEEATPEMIAQALGVQPPMTLDTSPPPETAANLEGDTSHRPMPATGDFLSDAGRYVMTAAMRGGANALDYLPSLVSRTFMNNPGAWNAISSLPPDASPEQKAAAIASILPRDEEGFANRFVDRFFANHMSEYEPTSGAGRMGLAASSGAVETLPFGPGGAVLGALSAGAQSVTSEYTDNPLIRTGAALAPLLLPGLHGKSLPEIDPGVARTAQRMADLGVDLRAPQIVPGGKAGMNGDVGQIRQYTRAVSHLIGEDTDILNNAVIDRARLRAQTTLDGVATRTGVEGDQFFHNALDAIGQDAAVHYPPNSPQLASVQHQINNLRTEVQLGPMNGSTYQFFTKGTGPISKLASDPLTAEFGTRLRSALDDALERTALANGDTEAVQDLRQARLTYKHVNMVGPLVNDTTGLVDPQKFQAAAKRSYPDYKGGYSRYTPDDVVTLAEGGKFLPSPTIQGDAKEVTQGSHFGRAFRYGGGAVGVGLGAAAGEHIYPELLELAKAHPTAAATAGVIAGLGIAGRRGYNAYRNSTGYRNLLIRKALGDSMVTPNMLLGSGMIATDEEPR